MGGRTGTGRARRRIGALTATTIVGATAAVVSVAPVAVHPVLAAPPTPQFTGDVNLSPASSSVDQLTHAGTSGLFFIADDGVHGTELWVTDGVAAPVMVTDINPSGSSDPRSLTAIGNVLWFNADDGTNGRELWRSDGTAGGTVLVADINPTGNGQPEDFVAFDSELYFTAQGPQGREIWHTDGTQVGTASFDIRVGSASSSPADLHRVDYPSAPAQPSRLWFSAQTGATNTGRELVSVDTDGNVVTQMTDLQPSELVSIGETLYLRARESVGPTAEDLYTVTRVGSAFTATSLGGQPFNLTVAGNDLYFTNNDPTVGQELYTVIAGALALVEDIRTGQPSSAPGALMASGAVLYFVADDGVHGSELWRTTAQNAASTDLVLDIEPGAVGSLPADLAGLAGTLLFTARTAAAGREPWLFDGTNAPFLLEDVAPGAPDSSPSGFRLVPTRGVFAAGYDPSVGSELLRIPTPPLPTATNPANVSVFADLRNGTDSAFPFEAAAAGDRVMFSANDGLIGNEPYVYDPVADTTTLLDDIDPGPGDSAPTGVADLGPTSVFAASDDTHGEELWVTDGTPAGTALVEDILPGATSSAIGPPVVVDGVAYFAADDGVAGSELWRSDGTAAGTQRIADVAPGAAGAEPEGLVPFGGDVYYAAQIGAARRLVRTDGSGPGTEVVAPALDGVTMLAATSTHMLFAPLDDDAGGSRVLWRTDGTLAGTVRVQTLDDAYLEEPRTAVSSGARVFFIASRSDTGAPGLWVSDGTAAGTVELLADDGLGSVSVLVPFGDGVVFAFDDGVHGTEPWVSDGTAAGTRVVDVVPGATGSGVGNIATMNGWAYFDARQAATGHELWRTDGTTTERVTDLTPGWGDGADGSGLWLVGDRLFFAGIDVAHGTELWFVEDVPPAPAAPTSPLAVAGIAAATVSWTAPPVVPGAPVTAYTVTAAPGGATCATTGALSCTVTGLTPGTSYTFTVRATNRIGTSPPSVASNAVVPTAPPPAMVPLVPARLLETRIGAGLDTVDGQFEGVGRQAGGTVSQLTVTGRGGVPANASAAMLNVTAVFPDGPGYLTVFPCGETQPLASSVNYGAGSVVPNAVLAKVGANGSVCIFTLVGTDVIVDVNGYVPAGGTPETVVPARVLETRSGPGLDTVDGLFEGGGRVGAGTVLELVVAGRGGVPDTADAVMLNVTAVFPDDPGYLTVFPCGETQPLASSVNYAEAQVVPNAVLAKVGAGGAVCIYTLAATDVIVDVNGYVPDGASPATVVPARLLETRVGEGLDTVDGQFEGIGRQGAGTVLPVTVVGRGGVPDDATAVMVNVTAVFPDGPGYLTVFPCGETQPLASNVNYSAGQVVPNAVLAKVGVGGRICVYTSSGTDLLIDVTGHL